jgi:high affinity sulfate transporter 1
LVERAFPVVGSAKAYRRTLVRHDLVAGLTVGAIALPAGMAFAQIAGLPPVAGLYALLLPTVAYTLLGSSRQLIVGPEGSTATLTAAALAPLAAGDPSRYVALGAVLALVVAAVFLVAWLARLGWVADYFSRAVLIGFVTGIAVTLIAGQLQKLTGVPVDGTSALAEFWSFVGHLDQIDWEVAAVGGTALLVILCLRRFAPRVPGPLVALVGGVIASAWLDFESRGIPVIGPIPRGLPSVRLPHLAFGDVRALLPAALGIFFVSFGDVILTGRMHAGRRGQHIQARQELLAIGAANAAASITQAFPVSSSDSRTAVNSETGAKTQFAGLAAAGFIAIVLVALTKPVSYLPTAVLGAVIVAAALSLINLPAWRGLATAARREIVIAAITTIGVVTIGVLRALIIAVVLSLVDAIARSARPYDAVLGYVPKLGRWANVSVHPQAQQTPGVLVYRLDDRLFFANASYVRGRVLEAIEGAATTTRFVVFDASPVSSVDATGLQMLEELQTELKRDGIQLVFAHVLTHVMTVLDQGGLVERIGADRFYPTVTAAVDACVAA